MLLSVSDKLLLKRVYKFPFEYEIVDIETSSNLCNVYRDKYIIKIKPKINIKYSNILYTCPGCYDFKILCVECEMCSDCNYRNCEYCNMFLDIVFNKYYIRHDYQDKQFYFYAIEPEDTKGEGLHKFFMDLYMKKE